MAGLRTYLISRLPLVYPGEIHTLGGESGFGGLAAQLSSTSPWPVSTLHDRKSKPGAGVAGESI
jgi:hypothetical protein